MRREPWVPFLAALAVGATIYWPYLLRPLFGVDSHPFPLHDAMLTEGRWGVFMLQSVLQGGSLKAVSTYYAVAIGVMALAALGMTRITIADRPLLQQCAMAIFVVANAAWVMLTPWALHFLGAAIGLVSIVAALWSFERWGLFGMVVAAGLLTISFSLYQQNAILAGCVWLVYALAELSRRSDRLITRTILWFWCVLAATFVYVVVLRYGFHAWINTGTWRESAQPFPQRLTELNLSRVKMTLESQYALFILAWLALSGVCMATARRWSTAVAAVLVILLGYLATYAFTIALGYGTFERMLMPLFFTAMLAPVVIGQGASAARACAVGAVLIALLVSARAGVYHQAVRQDNARAVAIVKRIYSQIENPKSLPIILVGNRTDCAYGKGDILVLCNYWRSHLFKGVTGNPRIESFSDVGKPEHKAFITAIPAWPAKGFAQEHEGILYVRIGPDMAWEQ